MTSASKAAFLKYILGCLRTMILCFILKNTESCSYKFLVNIHKDYLSVSSTVISDFKKIFR